MSEVPVVKIECEWAEGGFRLINESEFDAETMKLYEEKKPEAPKTAKSKEK